MGRAAFSYHYTVAPSGFVTLPEEEQRKKVGGFFDVLRVIRKPVRLRLARKAIDVIVGGRAAAMPVLQVHVSSGEPLGHVFDALGYDYTADLGAGAGLRLLGESWRHAAVGAAGGRALARCFTLDKVPYELPWAWVATGIFPACHEVVIWVEPVSHEDSLKIVRKRRELLYDAATRSRASAEEYEKLERAEESLRHANSGLFRCRVICVVIGADGRGLRAACREFRAAASLTGCRFATQAARQGAMLVNGWGRELTFDLGSMSCLYPMVSGDMLEVPNGMVLGINEDTGAPVVFDFHKRANYNMAIIGTSGSGKSFTAKMVLRRLLEKYPDSACFVVDPMGEYYDIAGALGLDRTELTGGGELGLDPLKLLEPADAADMLGAVARAPEDVVKQFRRHSERAGSIGGLYEALEGSPSQRWLDDLVDGPLARTMRGAPQDSDRLVVSLRGADGKPHEVMLLVLALNRVWQRIEGLPQETQKVVLLDEAWLLFKMPGAAKYVEQVVRMGRKRNVRFLFVSQNVADIAEGHGGSGRIVDNMETKVLLNMEDEAADGTARALGLSPEETARIKSSAPGSALVLTKKYRLHVRLEPSDEERRLFDTSPPGREA